MTTSEENAVKLAEIHGKIESLEIRVSAMPKIPADIVDMKIDVAVIKQAVEGMTKIWWLIGTIVATTVIGALLALIITSKKT